jgi:hypothetical protein
MPALVCRAHDSRRRGKPPPPLLSATYSHAHQLRHAQRMFHAHPLLTRVVCAFIPFTPYPNCAGQGLRGSHTWPRARHDAWCARLVQRRNPSARARPSVRSEAPGTLRAMRRRPVRRRPTLPTLWDSYSYTYITGRDRTIAAARYASTPRPHPYTRGARLRRHPRSLGGMMGRAP